MKRFNKEEWLEFLKKNISFEFITVEEVIEHNIAVCKCKCGNIFKRKAYRLTGQSNCGCLKNFVNSRAQKKYFSNSENRAKTSTAIKKVYTDKPEVKEKISNSVKEWVKENPNKRKAIGEKYSNWCKDNKEKRLAINKKISDWNKHNRDKVQAIANKNSDLMHKNRLGYINKFSNTEPYNKFISILHNDYIEPFINGFICTDDKVKTKCPKCGKYDSHYLRDLFSYNDFRIRDNIEPLCKNCYRSMTSSHYEDMLYEYITDLGYSCIRNDRNILSGKELDLYIPEKNVAIEFNGDYWHNSTRKNKSYHYEKFISCYNKSIILVSIFESKWKYDSEKIKKYLADLLLEIHNELSYDKAGFMNNNYPPPLSIIQSYKINPNFALSDYYISNKCKVYTCGYSEIHMK